MQLESFVTKVSLRADIDSRTEALCAVRATLETLGEGMQRRDAQGLAADLPPAVGAYLSLSLSRARVHMSLVEFVKRVSEREQVYLPVAATHARAVVQVIGESAHLSGGHGIGDVLPEGWQPLVATN